MAVKMSDATHERFYDVGKWQRILLIVIIMSKTTQWELSWIWPFLRHGMSGLIVP